MAIATISGRYKLVRRIRIATSFQSYEASHPRRPGRFTLDVFTGMDIRAAPSRAFLRDAATVSSLRHPHILQTLEISTMPDGTPIVVSELPPGQTLKAWLEAGQAPAPRTVVRWMTALAEAVDVAHAAGVIHGGIRAENVFLVEAAGRGTALPKLKGFGLERLREPPSQGPSQVAVAEAEAEAGPSVDGEPPEVQADARPSGEVGTALDLAALAGLAEQLFLASSPIRPGAEGAARLDQPMAAVLARASQAGAEPPFQSAVALAVAIEAAALATPSDVAPPRLERERGWPSERSSGSLRRLHRRSALALGLASLLFVVAATSAVLGSRRLTTAVPALGARASAPGGGTGSPPPGAPPTATATAGASPPVTTTGPAHARAAASGAADRARMTRPVVVDAPRSTPLAQETPDRAGGSRPALPRGPRHGIVWSPARGRLVELGELSPRVDGASSDRTRQTP
jgi:hypothetical protein